MRLLVIGGARFSGRALTGFAVDRGHQVTMFHRGGGPDDPWPEAEHIHGDRKDGFGALRGRSFDAVVDTCAYVTGDLRTAADAFPDVATYAFISSLSAHIDGVRAGATEDDDVHQPPFPDVQEMTWDLYGPLKAACEHLVRERYPRRALVIRPGYIVGPYDPTDRFTYWVRRAVRGGEMLAPGPPSYGMQSVDARDLAAFVLGLCEREVAGTFNVVTAPGRDTTGSILETARSLAGADTTFSWIDGGFARAEGLLEDPGDPLPMWHPEEANLHAFDTSHALDAGLETRPMEETIRDLLVWDDARGGPWPLRAGMDADRERELLAAWHARTRTSPVQGS
ncbi:MAG: epimerase [Actinomycetota bacterium]